jgi:hypothetical protein
MAALVALSHPADARFAFGHVSLTLSLPWRIA